VGVARGESGRQLSHFQVSNEGDSQSKETGAEKIETERNRQTGRKRRGEEGGGGRSEHESSSSSS